MCSSSLSPRTCKTNDELLLWVYTMHHLVNMKLQKKASPPLHVVDARLAVFDSVSAVDLMTLLVCMGESAVAAKNASAIHAIIHALPALREIFLTNRHICGGSKVSHILKPTPLRSAADVLAFLRKARKEMYEALDMEACGEDLRDTIASITNKAKALEEQEHKKKATMQEKSSSDTTSHISRRNKRRDASRVTMAVGPRWSIWKAS
eukprot:6214369-Pleurochrysis_carterae.AAC.3